MQIRKNANPQNVIINENYSKRKITEFELAECAIKKFSVVFSIISRMSDTSKKLQEWLDKYLNFEKLPQKNIFWLDTMEYLCAKFNHPEIFAPAIHVAGSKGKGSVSAMISSILDATGRNAGLYTSPHILDFFERITSSHRFFDENVYKNAADELISGIESIDRNDLPGKRPLTWFELVTLYAMLCFREEKVDYSVYEVGLGGRLDATNVVTPKVSVITPIELEHTEFLGDTVEKIAFEKGGIIKKNVPAVIAKQSESVKDVFRKIAEEKHSDLKFIDEVVDKIDFEYEDGYMNIEISSKIFKRPIKTKMRLLGKVQAENAALAAVAVKTALPKTTEREIEIGLAAAFLPGRFEIVNLERTFGLETMILDSAHTFNSEKYTIETFDAIFPSKKDATLLFGCAADKNVEKIAPLFKNHFSDIFITKPGNVKISDLDSMKKAFSDAELKFEADEDFEGMIRKAVKNATQKKAPLLITGSFYLVSEVKKLLNV